MDFQCICNPGQIAIVLVVVICLPLYLHLNSSDIRKVYYGVALGSNSLHLTLFVFLNLEDKLIPAVMSRYFCSFSWVWDTELNSLKCRLHYSESSTVQGASCTLSDHSWLFMNISRHHILMNLMACECDWQIRTIINEQ